jgi:hypothetical protein
VRALFLLLLLANLLFLAWSRWIVPPGPVTRDLATTGSAVPLRPIKLKEEAQGAISGVGVQALAAATDAIAAASCVSVGPFSDEAQASTAAAALGRLGFTSRLRAAQDEVRVGYWVRVPNLATPADAANALASLQAAGLTDAYLIGEEAPGNVVSIGVFASEAKATVVADAVVAAGFVPETSDRRRTLDVFWLDVDRQANGGIPEPGDVASAVEGGLPLELRACPSTPVDEAPPDADAATGGRADDVG